MPLALDSFGLVASVSTLTDEPAARNQADAVEFRMDLADDPLSAIDTYDGSLPILATNRPTWEGGDAPDTPGRLDALCRAVEYESVAAVDVELAAVTDSAERAATDSEFQPRGGDSEPRGGDCDPRGGDSEPRGGDSEPRDGERVTEHAREHDATVVVSIHDFERTPSQETMCERLREAGEYGDVAKLAVTAADPGDVLDLLGATWAVSQEGTTVATMAMGEAGRHSRAIAPLYGSRLGYAPVDPDDATAPGQYDLATLRELIDRLGGGTVSDPGADGVASDPDADGVASDPDADGRASDPNSDETE